MAANEARKRRGKPNLKGEQSRETILKAAERHFGEFGYRAVSTAAIANDAQISDPGLLHHFGSKDGLLMALLNRRYSVDAEKLRAGENLSGEQLVDTLRTIVDENEGKRDEVKLTMVLLGESIPHHHPGHEYFQARYVRARTMFAGHVKELQRRGELSDDLDPQALASVIIAVLDGLQMQWLLDPAVNMSQAASAFLSLLSSALRPNEESA
ncbi:TetR/AcrR family transcriptional regulator [uncultured Caulobacter sp.]|uniref:TetR/AcrR family transcriptional regulator n=1 Tax=uncultured Caulobacter sp. TaxID=158749 RepID=UPI0026349EE3|nr:TetR/AcrR family transcriptional regulator [uncultured Caulobacter sp.]